MPADRVPARHPDALEAEVDGHRVLMSPRGFAYFGLVDTGAVVWDRIDGETPLDVLVESLAAEYGADPAEVRADIEDFVDALAAAGLLADEG